MALALAVVRLWPAERTQEVRLADPTLAAASSSRVVKASWLCGQFDTKAEGPMSVRVRIATGEPGHRVGQNYSDQGRLYVIKFVRRLTPVGADHFFEELELYSPQEAS